MNKTTGFWYRLFDMPAIYNGVRTLLLFGKRKMFRELKEAIDLRDGETILDVGSGPGELSNLFSSEYAGIDYSNNYVKYAQKKYPNKKFFQGNVLDLTIPEKSYDIIMLVSFIHHFNDSEVKIIFKNVNKIARKRVIILEPCPWKSNPLAWLFLKLDRGAHIRTIEEQKGLIKENLKITKEKIFKSGLYKLSIVVGEPSQETKKGFK